MMQKTHLRKAVFGWKNKSTILVRKSIFLIEIDYSKLALMQFNVCRLLQKNLKEMFC